MNASHAFRSSLMQQLAASVRVQGHKPPLALMGWLSELNNNNNTAPEDGTMAAASHGVAASNKHKDEVVTSNNNNPTSLSSIQTNSSGCGCSSGSNGSHSRSLPATLPRSRSHSSFENLIKTTPTTASSPKRALTTTTTSSSSSTHQHSYWTSSSVPAASDAHHDVDDEDKNINNNHNDQHTLEKDRLMNPVDEKDATNQPHCSREEDSQDHHGSPTSSYPDGDDDDHLSSLFQSMIQTRRTNSHFAPRSLSPSSPLRWREPAKEQPHVGASGAPTSLPSYDETDKKFWKQALERAARCGFTAPNHKRTEPFTFKRLVAPSAPTRRLAEIAYEVSLRQQLEKKQHQKHDNEDEEDEETIRMMKATAQKKFDKWNAIPAFLVTLVNSSASLSTSTTTPKSKSEATTLWSSLDHDHSDVPDEENDDNNHDHWYTPLPFVPPQSEQEMEDYASACAAVQNVLLSLHSEHLATKWATGPVIRTPAFRNLVQAGPDDRVVALIMVGEPDEQRRSFLASRRRRHHRRQFYGDVLVDL